jgi:hypothetical protein
MAVTFTGSTIIVSYILEVRNSFGTLTGDRACLMNISIPMNAKVLEVLRV